MKNIAKVIRGGVAFALLASLGACVVAPPPHEGYYDGPHHRYYHENAWHDCGPHDDHWCH